jgi:hypothetical protein
MNIKQVVDRSKEYHGSLDPDTHPYREYIRHTEEGNGYMCGIGCNLVDPTKMLLATLKQSAYSLRSILIKLENHVFEYEGDPLIDKALTDRTFRDQLVYIQWIHDRSCSVKEYLEKLLEFEQHGYEPDIRLYGIKTNGNT